MNKLISKGSFQEELNNKKFIIITGVILLFYGLYQIFYTIKEEKFTAPPINHTIMRTVVNEEIYYLVIEELNEDQLFNFYYQSRENPNYFIGQRKSTICHTDNNKFVQPLLVRESVLKNKYQSFQNALKLSEQNNIEGFDGNINSDGTISGNININGNNNMQSETISGNININGNNNINSDGTISGNININGNDDMQSETISGNININSNDNMQSETISGNIDFNGNMQSETITGNINFNSKNVAESASENNSSRNSFKRYIHHMNVNRHPLDDKAILIEGKTNHQLLDIDSDSNKEYGLSGTKSFGNHIFSKGVDGMNFACFIQEKPHDKFSIFNMEQEKRDNESFSMFLNKISSDGKYLLGTDNMNNVSHEKNDVSLYIMVDGVKYYLGWLDDFRDRKNMKNTNHISHQPIPIIPVGFIPENYMNTGLHTSSPKFNIDKEFNHANKIKFDIIKIHI